VSIQQSIIKTLKYSHIFEFPLTDEEIYKFLIAETNYSYKKIKNLLNNLVRNKKIVKRDGHYFLPLGNLDWLIKREKSNRLFDVVFNKSKKDLRFLFKMPFVKFIGITGSVAAKNISNSADVDLFIISSKNYLWLTRLITVIYLKIKKKYRNPYCPNLYVSVDNLTWDTKNVYVANEIARIVPIFNKDMSFEKFLVKNSWVISYLPNFKNYLPKFKLRFKNYFLNYLFFPIEFTLFVFQYIYMKKNITKETVSLKKILFAKNDYSSKILSRFDQNL